MEAKTITIDSSTSDEERKELLLEMHFAIDDMLTECTEVSLRVRPIRYGTLGEFNAVQLALVIIKADEEPSIETEDQARAREAIEEAQTPAEAEDDTETPA